ncbi:hypothetical protein [Streptomyces griseorubiginosus]|uniref:hypothetical protein n=1 Tax=Streptomyces griseorubiginosus TaxID=67304 RepID=UPI002E7FF7CC|nr:hypothetical protein [Streptomyces griseorubiginosus]WUB45146.1 hypothetical protein OHN19_18055 [Streptomyces griseorubiginosus]WUB53663.1 hypothetical protein OG942_18050 [Streptomyces griseorubiginosus]
MRVVAVCGAAVAVLVGGGTAVGGTAVAAGGPEADLAYHGVAALSGGRMDLRFTPRNHGPAAVPDATVRLRWSEPLVEQQALPDGCAREAERVVLCRVGALAADAVGERVEMRVGLRGVPSEVLLEIDTVWNGGTVDLNRVNDRQRVLVLDSGDEYYF